MGAERVHRAWFASLSAVALGSGAFAQSGADLISDGNRKYAAKEFGAAAELYRQAQGTKNPPTAAALYNEGCALLEQGRPADAAERFRQADAGARDAAVAGRARFNLGQSLFRQAESAKEKEPGQALEMLRQSAAAFRSVLEVSPGDAEAARNVEVARRLMKQVEDKQREQQAQQQKQQQEEQRRREQEQKEAQKQADQLRDLAKRQEQAAKDSGEAQQSGADQQKTDELAKKQQELKSDTAKAQEQSKDGSASDQLKQAQDEQQKAAEELSKQNPGAAREHQEKAAKLLDQAAKEAEQRVNQAREQQGKDQKEQRAKADQPKDDKGEQGQQAHQAKAEPKKDQNYDKTAAALLERERRLRQQRMPVVRAARGSGPPVDKDW